MAGKTMKRREVLKLLGAAVVAAAATPLLKENAKYDVIEYYGEGEIIPWKAEDYDKKIGVGHFTERGWQLPVFEKSEDNARHNAQYPQSCVVVMG